MTTATSLVIMGTQFVWICHDLRLRNWGRSYEEYIRMFDLSDGDLEGRILCGGGDKMLRIRNV